MNKEDQDRCVRVVAGAEGCRQAVEDGAVAVMVDALRASATITSMIQSGARRVWVATHVEQARELARELGEVFLVGERGGFPPEGFDAGNTPGGVAELDLEGREVVFTSTTGAARLGQLEGAAAVLVGSPVNVSAVARAADARAANARTAPARAARPPGARARDADARDAEGRADREGGATDGAAFRRVYAIAAGLTGRDGGTEEDWLGAALVAQRLAREGYAWEGRDEGEEEHWPAGEITPGVVARRFAASPNGRGLEDKGLGADVAACSRVDWLDAVARVVGYRRIDDGPPVAELAGES